ncbi:hypothetical protein ZIOFF_008995 [Zingiber officinale]|uniref:TAFII28-like protein domain-containing protein n=1 Tax=Zingiber officinale TaxID=94328 RepID=A0A8J5LR59_ZINOF|nr:hypothetical protein ZIOFF_008995 [Zingiber officinale]
MKDPFEAAAEEQDSPPESPIPAEEDVAVAVDVDEEEADAPSQPQASAPPGPAGAGGGGKGKEEDEEEEEENMDVEFGKFPSGGDPDKMAKMQAILSQFTEEQMSRYESFRRSGFQKSNMRRVCLALTHHAIIDIIAHKYHQREMACLSGTALCDCRIHVEIYSLSFGIFI